MPLHTDRGYEQQLAQLRAAVLEMGGLVEDQIAQGVRALTDRDPALARATIDRDHTVNRYDVEVDDLCLKLLALHQPAARDLRLITTALKITTDLERIGDLAAHIAERALELDAEAPIEPKAESMIDLPLMANLARTMLHRALDAFVREDAELRSTCAAPRRDRQAARQPSARLAFMVTIPRPSRARCAALRPKNRRGHDHATNIAEMVISS
jgi:phosphate transport system protein